jgi:hypothetical protein
VSFCYLEWYRLQRLQEGRAREQRYWERARTHGLRLAVVQEIEEEEVRQLYFWALEGKGRQQLRALLGAAYEARSIAQIA